LVKVTSVVTLGLAARAPRAKALMSRSTWGTALAATKASFRLLVIRPAVTPAT
jgi:hypothetical protein